MTDKNQNPDETPKVNDKRRIDPETGEVRQPEQTAGSEAEASGPSAQEDAAAAASDDELTVDDILAAKPETADEGEAGSDREAELLHDLKRVNAEYANYRRRTEENREAEKQRTTGTVISALLPVLDDLDRAEKHGDLEADSAFAQIASKLRQAVERLGLAKFGAKGEPFDHNLHEAIFQQPSADVDTETILEVVETGYFVGDILLRAAKVVVAVPSK
ncbi:molecular chaperone GrpE [Paramicrobacterium humi]|uniref:Protein GrpE n=1 Tax=Paramicrobacterium humi TaxID=640635 RepID=A0A1H4M0P5_9MICO|nr:nucleotide exchange factor GrpE [Microbacterium humi]SEB76601.1 molecular chaperone GrpE [Microbacterium humi]